MGTRLSSSAVAAYERDGFAFPIRVLSAAEAREVRLRLEGVERLQGGPLRGELRHKAHLVFTWLDRLARDPAYVSWHQDATYWGLSQPDIVTAWVAFTDATVENGAMRMVPGSHRAQVPHRDTFAPSNLLSRGQEIAVEVDEGRAVDILLRAGEMSLHHVLMFHSSPPNRSDDRRIGFAVRYIPTSVRQVAGEGDSALLVRGTDGYHHFEPEEPPARDLAPEALARHAAIMKRQAQILYRGTGIDRFK